MKKYLSIVSLFVFSISYGQYSNYYQVDANVNQNVNVSGSVDVYQNVDVSGTVNVNKTVTSIDYGALAQANAMRQRNAIERMKIANENERAALFAIAQDPVKAYDYGTDNNWKLPSKTRKQYSWPKKIKTMYHKIPHKSLFVRGGSEGYTYINESDNGVKTELIIYVAAGEDVVTGLYKDIINNPEKALSFNQYTVGEVNADMGFLHKKEIKRTKVARTDGFVGTLIFEDKYEKRITDNYASIAVVDGKRYLLGVKVRYRGDRDEVTFEELEGRKYYFKRFINKTISTINYY